MTFICHDSIRHGANVGPLSRWFPTCFEISKHGGRGKSRGEREDRSSIESSVRIVRVLATLRRAPIVDNSMVVVRLITVPIPCSDAYVSRSGGSSQIWMIIGRTRLIYEYRNGRCLLDEINLHYTTLSRLVASSIDAGGGNGGGGGHRCR